MSIFTPNPGKYLIQTNKFVDEVVANLGTINIYTQDANAFDWSNGNAAEWYPLITLTGTYTPEELENVFLQIRYSTSTSDWASYNIARYVVPLVPFASNGVPDVFGASGATIPSQKIFANNMSIQLSNRSGKSLTVKRFNIISINPKRGF